MGPASVARQQCDPNIAVTCLLVRKEHRFTQWCSPPASHQTLCCDNARVSSGSPAHPQPSISPIQTQDSSTFFASPADAQHILVEKRLHFRKLRKMERLFHSSIPPKSNSSQPGRRLWRNSGAKRTDSSVVNVKTPARGSGRESRDIRFSAPQCSRTCGCWICVVGPVHGGELPDLHPFETEDILVHANPCTTLAARSLVISAIVS